MDRNVTVTTGLLDTYCTPTLLRLLAAHQLDAHPFITHRFGFDDFMVAYDVFSRVLAGRGRRGAEGGAHPLGAAGVMTATP